MRLVIFKLYHVNVQNAVCIKSYLATRFKSVKDVNKRQELKNSRT